MTFHFPRFRILTLTFIIPLFVLGGVIARPNPTHALFGVGDAVIVLKDITRDATILPKELGLDGIAWTVAKMLVGNIINDLRSFINSGFFGDELLITDPDAFFAKLSRDVTTAFMSEVSETDIYAPIKTEILKLLSQSYTPYTERAQSTINKTLINPEAFENDFAQGGWSGFLALHEPENNGYGQAYMAMEEQGKRASQAIKNVETELNQSGGILSLPGKCLEPVGVDKNLDGTVDANDGCARWERLTPGQFIGNTLSEALGSPLRSIENADEIEEFLASMIQNLVMGLLSDGVSSLAGSGSSSSSGNSSSGFEEVVGQDDKIIETIEKEIVLTENALALHDTIIDGTQTATLAISEINDILSYMDTRNMNVIVDIDDTIIITRTSLLSLQKEAENLVEGLDEMETHFNDSRITEAYLASLHTLQSDALNADTASEIIRIYTRFNNIYEPIETYSRSLLLESGGDIEEAHNRIHTIYNEVTALTFHLSEKQDGDDEGDGEDDD